MVSHYPDLFQQVLIRQYRFQNKRQSMRNTHRQSGSIRGPGTDSPSTTSSAAAHSGSRPSHNPANITTMPAPNPRASIASHTQSTYVPPSPTDPSYYMVARPAQTHGQTSTSHRPPSRSSYSEYYEGSRRSRS